MIFVFLFLFLWVGLVGGWGIRINAGVDRIVGRNLLLCYYNKVWPQSITLSVP